MQEVLEGKREEIRKKNRNEYKQELLKRMRAEWISEMDNDKQTRKPFDKEEVFRECELDHDEGYERLGAELLEVGAENYLVAETFGKMLRYSKCKHYSWVVLITVYYMVDVLDNFEPLLQAYLPIVDMLIDNQNPTYTLERGITSLYLMSRIKSAPERVIRIGNFKSLLNEYVYSKDEKHMQLQSIEIVMFCLEKLADRPEELKIMVDQGLLRVISDLLAVGFKSQQHMLEGFQGLLKHQQFHDVIMADETLLSSLQKRHLLGKAEIKYKVFEIWKQFVENLHAGHLIKLISFGVLDNLLEGVRNYEEDAKSTKVCLQAIYHLLQRLNLCSMNEVDYINVVNSLRASNFPQMLAAIQQKNIDLSELSEKIQREFLDQTENMIVE